MSRLLLLPTINNTITLLHTPRYHFDITPWIRTNSLRNCHRQTIQRDAELPPVEESPKIPHFSPYGRIAVLFNEMCLASTLLIVQPGQRGNGTEMLNFSDVALLRHWMRLGGNAPGSRLSPISLAFQLRVFLLSLSPFGSDGSNPLAIALLLLPLCSGPPWHDAALSNMLKMRLEFKCNEVEFPLLNRRMFRVMFMDGFCLKYEF
ncbi:hypothetical protein AVEN_171596-1 [Araneus ventricosus]|uniref:Uncharacterized protein n=1 Tax=Araneus ventricosus TaxID=182803 RepID=A0A4Y2FL53_ARAVE|nr:hypothetical protein AVEN_191182-1 [Araneus ventricosus]GBM41102.1 hypothetical protein AVEN_32720-1 [Araneus ventricosus]GBM41123.1 hypothetical protein AVEN_73384-1 [Araneus ventricosus]GBM41143.1 hypothetical protein AVEN_171596-1 [Araneus ventricosus]